MNELVLIGCPGREDQGERILHVAEWMGVGTRKIIIGDRAGLEHFIGKLGGGRCNVVISEDTLVRLRKLVPADDLRHFIKDRCARLLVFSVGGRSPDADVFNWLTGGAVAGVTPPEARQAFRFPDGGRRFSGPFAGQSFASRQDAPVSAFGLSEAASAILLADGRPVFVRCQQSACEVFLLALGRLADIGEPVSPSKPVEDYYDQLIPLLIFLRHAFGAMCWHAPQSTARLIIDDPLLTHRYGCLDFSALRKSMRSVGYGTSIAFIPWNHWRTSTRQAAKLVDGSPDLSICVHGCDHTNREFEDVDPASLQWKADTALRRMERHQGRTRVPFEPVMVFPQGIFSRPAISALRAGGYVAAVNTTCFPVSGEVEPLTIADFLRPAITKFDGFPLFPRRYPRRLVDCAFDLFVGRPALLVQHHEDFRDGYRRFEEFVAGLHKLEPALSWSGLSVQLMQSCMMRALPEGRTEVRFFTSQFEFTDTQSAPATLVFSKEEPDASIISRVVVDGASVPFSSRHGLLTFEHRVDPGRTVHVEVFDKARTTARAPKAPAWGHSVTVVARRALSEFRDKALVRHPRLLAAATRMAAGLKMTGEDAR